MGMFGGGPDPSTAIKAQKDMADLARGQAQQGRKAEMQYLGGGPRTQSEQELDALARSRFGGQPIQQMYGDSAAQAARGGMNRLNALARNPVLDNKLQANMANRAMQTYQSPGAAALAQNFQNIALGKTKTAAESLGQAQMQNAGRQIMDTAARGGAFSAAGIRGATNAASQVMPQMAAQIAGLAGQERLGAGAQGAGLETNQAQLRNQLGAIAQQNQLAGKQVAGQLGAMASQAGLGAQQAMTQEDLNFMNQLRQNAAERLGIRQAAENQILSPYVQSMAPGASVYNTAANQQIANDQNLMKFGGGIMSGLGGLFMSDKDAKEDIKEDDAKIKSFLNSLKPYEYRYKKKVRGSEIAPEGRHVSVMAQDLEKSKVGRKAVIDTQVGKVVDYGKLAPAMLASLAYLNKKIEKGDK